MPPILFAHALRRRLPLLLLICLWPFAPCGASAAAATAPPLSAGHYLIPGFSEHLLTEGRLIYDDLEQARNAARDHHALALRLALADASGHLLQLATPPALSGLREQMVVLKRLLATRPGVRAVPAWRRLIALIGKLPLHRADRAARARLQWNAEQGLKLSAKGDATGARRELSKLISEIEITSHVFPITAVRESVGGAVTAASALSPRWPQASSSIDTALQQTRWITSAEASHMVRAFDALVAAYVQQPDSLADARRSLRLAARWLSFNRSDHDGDGDAALLQATRRAARTHALTLRQVDRLQTRLASAIGRERAAAAMQKR